MFHCIKLCVPLFLVLGWSALAQPVAGRVLDAATGQPLRDATVTLTPPGSTVATDASGAFTFSTAAGRGAVLTVTYVGYAKFRRGLDSLDGRPFVIRLEQIPMPGPEIRIFAQRATERSSPVTFSDVPRASLEERYFGLDAPVMLADLPSSTFYSESGNGLGYTYLRIRGFDQRRVAVMVNGIPQNDPEDHNVYWLDFADLLGSASDVQVQRGGGNVFYGPPAIGGSINVVTGDFADKKGVTLSMGAGSYGTMRSAIAVGSGLVDNRYVIFGRLSNTVTDGYRDHSYSRLNSYYLSATRYDSTFTTRIILYGGPLEDGLAYYGLPKFAIGDRTLRRRNYNYWEARADSFTYVQKRRDEEHEEFTQPHIELHNEWAISENLSFNSSAFYFSGKGYFDYDGTGYTNAQYFRLTPEFGFNNATDPQNPIIRAYVDNQQIGWLPRISWTHGRGTLVAGLELRFHRSLHWGRIQSAGGLPENLDPYRRYYEFRGGKDVMSLYAQEMYRLTPAITIMGNLQTVASRYLLYDEKYVGTDFSVPYRFINPGIGVNANLSDEWNVYGNVNYTQREPRLNNLYDAAEASGGAIPQFETSAQGTPDFSKPLVKPESMLDVEIGAGYSTERLHVFVNGFMMDFRNEIVKSGQLDRFGQPVTGNAPRSLHLGIELAMALQVVTGLQLDMNISASRDRLKDYTVWEVEGATSVARDLAGNRIAGFPELIGNAMLTYRWSRLWASLQWKYVGNQYTDNFQNADNMVDPYSVMNLTVGARLPRILGFTGMTARLTVINLLDRLYAQAGEGDQFFPAAERNFMFDVSVDL